MYFSVLTKNRVQVALLMGKPEEPTDKTACLQEPGLPGLHFQPHA